MRDVELLNPPGTTFTYANANDSVLGLLVQTVSGQPFADYMNEHVFVPAGMLLRYSWPLALATFGAQVAGVAWSLRELRTPAVVR